MAVKSLGTLTLDIIAKTAGFTGPIEKAGKTLKKETAGMAESAAKAAKGVAAISGVALGAATAMVAFTKVIADNAAELEKQANVANASAAEMQAWGAAASAVGLEADKMADIFKDAQDKIGDFAATGGGELADFFNNVAAKVGVTVEDFQNLSGPESMGLFLDTLEKAGVSAQEMTFYLEGLADEGTILGTEFASMAAEAQHVTDMLNDMGVAITELDVANLADLKTAMTEVDTVVGALAQTVGAELSPYITELITELLNLVTGFDDTRTAVDSLLDGMIDFAVNSEREMRAVEGFFNDLNIASQEMAVGIVSAFASVETKVEEMINVMLGAVNKLGEGLAALPGTEGFQVDLLDPASGPLQTHLDTLNAQLDQLKQSADDLANRPLVTEQYRDAVDARKTFNQLTTTAALVTEQNTNAISNNAAATKAATDATKGAAAASKAASEATREQEKAEQEAAKAAQQQVDAYTSLLETLYPLQTSQKEYTEDLALLDQAFKDGAISADELADAQQRLAEQSAKGLGDFDTAPTFGGLDALIGGISGEMGKVAEASDALEEWRSDQLDQLAEYREERADLTEEWNQKELELDAEYLKQKEALHQASNLLIFKSGEAMFGDLAEATKVAAGEQSKAYQVMFAASKAFAIADSTVQILDGIAKASNLPWPENLAAMASVAAATASIVGDIQAVNMVGQAHDGIMSVPASGTWNLQQGERVLPKDTALGMDQMMSDVQKNSQNAAPEINVYEDAANAGQVNTSQDPSGRDVIDIVVANIAGDGKIHTTMAGKYRLKTAGS